MRMHTRFLSLLAWLAALAAAQGAHAQPTRATTLASVSPAHCVTALERRETPDPLRCPAALRSALEEARATCRDVGGKLEGAVEGTVWSLDVNDDGRNELMFDIDSNVTCIDAWSVFACGSLGCPKTLYELRDDMWAVVGHISATWPEQVSVGTERAPDGHRSLEACRLDGCAERWIYEWRDGRYQMTRVEVRGTRVQIEGSVNGIYPLNTAMVVRATPAPNGADLGRYPAGTDVSIIGTAGDWYYVSPCNACDSGFVPRSALSLR
jgi:enamine deaminase RidA (YjgF/YER057c/UK114 family)